MKQQWTSQELIDHWALTQKEIVLAQSISKIDHNQLGYTLMLKYFQSEGKYPQRKQDIPDQIISYCSTTSYPGKRLCLLQLDRKNTEATPLKYPLIIRISNRHSCRY